MIFNPFSSHIHLDFRGTFLIIKATLRLAMLGLDNFEKSLSHLILNWDFKGKKISFFVTHVSEQSVTYVTDCTLYIKE